MTDNTENHDDLNRKLKQNGMFTIEEMMDDKVSGLSPFDTHLGVNTFDDVCEWVDKRRLEFTRMRARDEVSDTKSELYEWVLAHGAAFTTISKHLRKARDAQSSQIQDLNDEIERLHRAILEITYEDNGEIRNAKQDWVDLSVQCPVLKDVFKSARAAQSKKQGG